MTFPYPRPAFAVRTPLYLACAAGDEGQARQLLAAGPDINDGGGDKDTSPLIAAAQAGHANIVALLLSQNAQIDLGIDKGGSACGSGHLDVVEILLGAGADYHRSQSHQGTPIQWAAVNGKTAIVELFLDKGESLNPRPRDRFEDCKTPLFCAAKEGYEHTMGMLIKRGADVNLRSIIGNQGLSPLYAATLGDYPLGPRWRGTPSARKERERPSIVRLLINPGANLNDLPAFHNAAYGGQINIIKIFIDAGVDINDEGDRGTNRPRGTALQEPAGRGHIEVIELLLAAGAGAYINTQNDCMPPLIAAAWENYQTIVKMLLVAGADIDVRDEEGQTVLEIMANIGNYDMVKLLLAANDKGPNVGPALVAASDRGHADIVRFLLGSTPDVNLEDAKALRGAIRVVRTTSCSSCAIGARLLAPKLAETNALGSERNGLLALYEASHVLSPF